MAKPPRDTTEAAEAVLMAAQFVFTISLLHMGVLRSCPKTLAFMFLSGSESEVPTKMSIGSTIMQSPRNDCGYAERLFAARTSLNTRLSGFAVIGGEAGAGQFAEWLPEGTILQQCRSEQSPQSFIASKLRHVTHGKRRVRGLRTTR